MTDDADVPTPNQTGSWLVFSTGAAELARRLEKGAIAKKSGNIVIRDPEGAGRFLERAEFLRWMSGEFERWPTEPEKAAVERTTLGPLLITLKRQTEEDFAKMPPGPWSNLPPPPGSSGWRSGQE